MKNYTAVEGTEKSAKICNSLKSLTKIIRQQCPIDGHDSTESYRAT